MSLSVSVGDMRLFKVTLQPKQVGRHHTHTNEHSNAQSSMCVSMQNAWGGSDLDTDGESAQQWMRGEGKGCLQRCIEYKQ